MRLKWRRLSGPAWRMPVYLSFSSMMLACPLGSIRGRASSSPRIWASSSRVSSTSRMWCPGASPAPWPVLAVAGAADRGADVAGPLADAAAVLGAVAELGDLDLRQRDRDELAARLADHLAVGDVLPQVGLDLAADDLLEPIGIALDFSHHGSSALAVAD